MPTLEEEHAPDQQRIEVVARSVANSWGAWGSLSIPVNLAGERLQAKPFMAITDELQNPTALIVRWDHWKHEGDIQYGLVLQDSGEWILRSTALVSFTIAEPSILELIEHGLFDQDE